LDPAQLLPPIQPPVNTDDGITDAARLLTALNHPSLVLVASQIRKDNPEIDLTAGAELTGTDDGQLQSGFDTTRSTTEK
jgi:hypothetical protein